MPQTIFFQDLQVQPYKKVWDMQEALLTKMVTAKPLQRQEASVIEPAAAQYLFFVEHPPVYTLGKNGNAANLLIEDNERDKKGIAYFRSSRGGDITFHGYGQLVAYPILDLSKFKTDLTWYLRALEEVVIRTLATYGIQGERSKGETGVWLDADVVGKARKICAIGIKCSRWVTMHGFAFNINTDLSYFDNIIPCGIVNKKVTSLQQELSYEVPLSEVKIEVKNNFEQVFNVHLLHKDCVMLSNLISP